MTVLCISLGQQFLQVVKCNKVELFVNYSLLLHIDIRNCHSHRSVICMTGAYTNKSSSNCTKVVITCDQEIWSNVLALCNDISLSILKLIWIYIQMNKPLETMPWAQSVELPSCCLQHLHVQHYQIIASFFSSFLLFWTSVFGDSEYMCMNWLSTKKTMKLWIYSKPLVFSRLTAADEKEIRQNIEIKLK